MCRRVAWNVFFCKMLNSHWYASVKPLQYYPVLLLISCVSIMYLSETAILQEDAMQREYYSLRVSEMM